MAMIKCPECDKEISDKAEYCPHCGYKPNVEETKKEIPEELKQNAKQYDKSLSICYAIVAGLIILLFIFLLNVDNDVYIYPFIILFIVMYFVIKILKIGKRETLGSWNDQYETEVNGKLTATVCPNCGSNDIDISINTIGETYNGRNEVRKKSVVTRGVNKKARKGMIVATGGLWALTPKKSDYKEIQKGNTTYRQVKTCICKKCGSNWNL